ncbi:MAG: peptide chain release factor 1 [Candidatus Pacebacteria bacterium]|nr:peptide chain release factor 1 [Candidatus Paceibacterota bacterium]
MNNIETLRKEHEDILAQLSNPELLSDWEKFQELLKRKNFLEKIFETEKEISETKNKIEENKLIISGGEDPELVSLAEGEILQLQEKEKSLIKNLDSLLNGNEDPEEALSANAQKSEGMSAIIEIRAGTGGDEAALFVGDLYRMYSRYAQNKGWRLKNLDSSPAGIGGFKEIIFELSGNVFEKMQYEGGVHRVQRIPETEKSGRIHTSTASVAVLPKPKKAEIKIKPDEIKIDFYCSSGPGGQYVNKRHTAVRITHLPTGLVVTSQTERDQFQNKNNALSILEAKLLEQQITSENEKISGKRKTQIGQAKRAEKIRTYNFPQDRLTDHRIKKSFHNLEAIMDGKLDQIIESLEKNLNT